MSANMKQKENGTVTLEITVDKEAFNKAINQAYQKNRGKYSVPGFRKGKAPRKLIETHYGEGVFYDEAIDEAFPQAYREAVEELGIEPKSMPQLTSVDIDEDKNVTMEVQVAVAPEVKLGEYKGLKINSIEPEVSDEEIQSDIDKLIDQNARLVSVEEEAGLGDTVNIDYKGFIDDEAFEGGEAQAHALELGSGQFIHGFEDQLVGKKAGDEVDVIVTFPEVYPAEELAGKEAVFKVIVNDVLKKELPEFDDDFVMDISEFDTVEEFKSDLIEKKKEQKKDVLLRAAEERIISQLIENSEIELSELIVAAEAQDLIRDYEDRVKRMGVSLEQYLSIMGIDSKVFISQMEEEARRKIQYEALLDAIVEAESITPTDEEIDAEIENQASLYQMEVDMFKHQFLQGEGMNIFMDLLKKRMAAKALLDWAEQVEEVEEAAAEEEE